MVYGSRQTKLQKNLTSKFNNMYSLYDLYKDIMAGRKSSFTYEGIEFVVYQHRFPGPIEVIYYNKETKDRWRAFAMRKNVTCGSDLQGLAASLLYYKKDIWFDRNGELCTEKEFSPNITKEQQEEDRLQALINSVLDLDTNDNSII